MSLHFRDRLGAASLWYRDRTEITIFTCELKPLVIQYGFRQFRAGAKAIWYSVNLAKIEL